MDGKALVDSCDDPSCCSEQFKDSLSIIDWKSSNALHVEYILQVAGAYCHAEVEEFGEDIQNCFILRLGKNEEEAGKFEPWRIPAKDFPEAFQGFLTCLNLGRLLGSTKDRMSTQKKGVREIKKQQKAVLKELAKVQAKLDRTAEKAQLKLTRAAEKERIKTEAKKNREEMKNAAKTCSVPQPEVPGDTPNDQALSVCESVRDVAPESSLDAGSEVAAPAGGLLEEGVVERKPFIIPEEG
jgi:hypothetical protein